MWMEDVSHTIRAHCSRSIPRETWGLVGVVAGRRIVFATCDLCHEAGWRPPDYVRVA